MISKAAILFLALTGVAQAKCLVEREGLPPAFVTNVQDADCDMFNFDFKAGRSVARYYVERSVKDTMQPGHVDTGKKK